MPTAQETDKITEKQTKDEKLWNQLEKELEKKWLIIEINGGDNKTSMKTYPLKTIMQIIEQNKITNKIEWTIMIKAHLEKLIEMGHGDKLMQIKIKITPKTQDKSIQQISILRTADESGSYEDESINLKEDSEDEYEDSENEIENSNNTQEIYEDLTEKLQYLLEEDPQELEINIAIEEDADKLFSELKEHQLLDNHIIENKFDKNAEDLDKALIEK